jgi:hypothetical protein
MGLATFTELKAAVATWLRRTDLTADIPDFITLAEAQINRRLKNAKLVGVATATISDEYSDVPADFGGVVSFDLDTTPPTHLAGLAAPELADIARRINGVGRPAAYAVVGTQFRYAPAPDASYSAILTYYQRLVALSDAEPSNWVLEKHPDVYLYGALAQSAPYLRADERLSMWGGLFATALDDLITDVERDRAGARPARRMRSFG